MKTFPVDEISTSPESERVISPKPNPAFITDISQKLEVGISSALCNPTGTLFMCTAMPPEYSPSIYQASFSTKVPSLLALASIREVTLPK